MSSHYSFHSSIKYSLLILLLLGLFPFSSVQAQEEGSTFIPRPAVPSDLTDLQEIEESAESSETQSTQSDLDSEESSAESLPLEAETFNFFDAPYLLFTTIQFQNQSELDDFLNLVKQDEEAENQFTFEQTKLENDVLLLKSNYTEQATPDGRKIVYYISVDFPTQAEADKLVERLTHLYPDLFFAGQAFPLENGTYDVILGVRTNIDAQGIRYNSVDQTIDYDHQREPYTYTVPEGQPDAIQATITEEYPEAFEFEETELADGSKQVTMSPRTEENRFGIDTQSWQERFINWVTNLPLTYNQIVIATVIVVVILLALIVWLFFIK